jgi:hypothetical protein
MGSTVAFHPHRPLGRGRGVAYGDHESVADAYLILRMLVSGDARERLVPRTRYARRLRQARATREQQQAES